MPDSQSSASRILSAALCAATVTGTLALFGSVPLIARMAAFFENTGSTQLQSQTPALSSLAQRQALHPPARSIGNTLY